MLWNSTNNANNGPGSPNGGGWAPPLPSPPPLHSAPSSPRPPLPPTPPGGITGAAGAVGNGAVPPPAGSDTGALRDSLMSRLAAAGVGGPAQLPGGGAAGVPNGPSLLSRHRWVGGFCLRLCVVCAPREKAVLDKAVPEGGVGQVA